MRDAATHRLYRYYLALAARCSAVLDLSRVLLRTDSGNTAELPALTAPDEIAVWFSAARSGLTAVIRQAQRDRAEPYSWQLPYAADALFKHRGPRAHAIEMLEGAIAVVPVGDRFRPRLLNNLGVAYGMSGRLAPARACWEEALALTQDGEVGEVGEEVASYLTNIAIVDAEVGDRDAALRGYEEALALRRSLGDPKIAYTLVNLARLRIDGRDLDGATDDLTESLQVGRATDDPAVIAASLLELGRVEAARGDSPAALDLLTSALEHADAHADDHLTAEIHRHIAELAPAGSAKAAEHIRAAYRLYARIGDPVADELIRRHADVLTTS